MLGRRYSIPHSIGPKSRGGLGSGSVMEVWQPGPVCDLAASHHLPMWILTPPPTVLGRYGGFSPAG